MTDARETARDLQEIRDHLADLAASVPVLGAYVHAPSGGDGETPYVDTSGTTDPTGQTVARNLAAGNRITEKASTPAKPWPPSREHHAALRLIREARNALRGATAAVSRALAGGASPDDITQEKARHCGHCEQGPIPPGQLRRGLCPACHAYRRRTGNDRPTGGA